MAEPSIPGLEMPDTKLNLANAKWMEANPHLQLGEDVKISISGHVVMVGEEQDDDGIRRRLVKIQADHIALA
jgi:hypothetical protein